MSLSDLSLASAKGSTSSKYDKRAEPPENESGKGTGDNGSLHVVAIRPATHSSQHTSEHTYSSSKDLESNITMTRRHVYLAKSGGSSTQRAHFGIFIPNADSDATTIEDHKSSCAGTIIHVVGEPLMMGFALQFKRNYECSTAVDLKGLVFLGYVDSKDIYDSNSSDYLEENVPRGPLERFAATVAPPPKGQDIGAPIDGVNTKRCQEWTIEVLKLLAQKGLIEESAVGTAEEQRDAPTFGIFGYKKAM